MKTKLVTTSVIASLLTLSLSCITPAMADDNTTDSQSMSNLMDNSNSNQDSNSMGGSGLSQNSNDLTGMNNGTQSNNNDEGGPDTATGDDDY